ncbi:cytochrome P450 monooxygenase pc-bph [Rickenella mellea]|uniref:Cytochrome P450 monooxygenase pc-bph n=1 Tax=Rickenella mellea TaxID=50990 RepID=A0A4Y7QEI9_9AGAM|nr:cytochrome P450 monooxygenase pc-bph [Rickenella mellea]
MSIVDTLVALNPLFLVALLPGFLLLAHLVQYVIDPHRIRANDVPGPFVAKFTEAWLGWVAAQGHRSEVVHKVHQKYGPFVRLAPNHVSISDPEALQIVYAHGNGALKSDFYDAFFNIRRTLFTTRDRAEHTRKRKIVSHVFAPKSTREFEPHIRAHVGSLLRQWDRLADGGAKGEQGSDGQGGWKGHNGRVWLDALPWYNYLAFDIIGDLAFGSPFGMINAGRDYAAVAVTQSDALSGNEKVTTTYIPAVQILNDRGDFSASMGVLPPWVRPLVRKLPWYANGSKAVKNLAGLAVAAVSKRLAEPSGRTDLLSKLQEGKDDDGNPMGRDELTAEALTQLIAGSDTTSNSSCAITFHLAANPSVQAKLQQELDNALGTEDDPVAHYEDVKRLTYLEAVINEGLRMHSTSAMGLARIVPAGGLTVLGTHFPPGTVLSVPSFSIHRDKATWGDDADYYRPERWMERDPALIQRAFNPFSFGPRACIGRNLAMMELSIIIASVLRRYHFVLENPDLPLDTREGFLRKPLECRVGLKRREL